MKTKIQIIMLLLAVILVGCSRQGATNGGIPPQISSEKFISEEEAIDISLQHEGFSFDQITAFMVQFEYDNGQPEYDVQIRKDRQDYEYEIHAVTGQILSREIDD